MKTFFICICLLSASIQSYAYNPTEWIELNKIYVAKDFPTQQDVICINSYLEKGQKAAQWHEVDVSSMVGENAKAVNLVGKLVITHGNNQETADLHLHFRRAGNFENCRYAAQIIEASSKNGQRSNLSIWVPLSEDKKFEFMWTRTNPGQYPDWSSYGIYLDLNAWGE